METELSISLIHLAWTFEISFLCNIIQLLKNEENRIRQGNPVASYERPRFFVTTSASHTYIVIYI